MTNGPACYLESQRKADCAGCAACVFVCPVKALSMQEDSCGFEYPLLNKGACIDCGKCIQVCPMSQSPDLKNAGPLVSFGAICKDGELLERSASGGVAAVFALNAVSEGGIVYGCVAERENVHHERLAEVKALCRSQGSKYVQSDIAQAFSSVAKDLKAGKKTLFIGTPCQCAAMKAAFGRSDNLLLVDLLCEGVPSRRMYKDFLDDIERKCGEKVVDFLFRDKRCGWSTKNAVVFGEGGRTMGRRPHFFFYYYWLFSNALILRESCYSCPYASVRRTGDVTIGDFWGAETAGLGYGIPELRGGVSCMLVNSSKGKEAVNLSKSLLDVRECSVEVISRSNSCLVGPSKCNKSVRKRVLSAYAEYGAEGMESEYKTLFTRGERLKADAIANMPLAIKVFLKRVKNAIKGGR